MAGKRKRSTQHREAFTAEKYNVRSLHEEREYGLYWYAWLWRILRPILIFLCAVTIVVGLVSEGYKRIYNAYLAPVDVLSAETVNFEIESGSSVSQIGQKLREQNLLRSDAVFRYMVQLQGLTGSISYGTYALSPSMTVSEIISELTSGSQNNERVVTIVPGWTCENIADYLLGIGAISDRQGFLSLCNNTDLFAGSSYALTNAVREASGDMSRRKYALEGYLAPDTYRIFLSASPESILNTLLKQDNEVVDDVFYGDVQYYQDEEGNFHEANTYKSDLSMDQIIILASIIEREATTEEDYARVSAVFHNRLKMGWKLESDPTATYLSGENKLVLSESEISSPNSYNTYYVSGLPAGPICNPSKAALKAAQNPDIQYIQEGYLYFCTGEPGTGTLLFSRTKEEHEANVEKYLPLWEEYDRQMQSR